MGVLHQKCSQGELKMTTNSVLFSCGWTLWRHQLEDAGSSSLDALLSRWISASTYPQLGLWPPVDMNPSPGLSTHSPGSSGTGGLQHTQLQFHLWFWNHLSKTNAHITVTFYEDNRLYHMTSILLLGLNTGVPGLPDHTPFRFPRNILNGPVD